MYNVCHLLYRSKNAKHCRICDKCVNGFDHHCKWLNTCVGDRNYKSVPSLLMYTSQFLYVYPYFLPPQIFYSYNYIWINRSSVYCPHVSNFLHYFFCISRKLEIFL